MYFRKPKEINISIIITDLLVASLVFYFMANHETSDLSPIMLTVRRVWIISGFAAVFVNSLYIPARLSLPNIVFVGFAVLMGPLCWAIVIGVGIFRHIKEKRNETSKV